MPSFAEQYRPTTLADFVGNATAVDTARYWLARGLGGLAFWISGVSGVGKTTLARILAATVATSIAIQEYDSADQLTTKELDRIRATMTCRGMGRGGRVYIVNEAHGLKKSALRQLLGILEPIPPHVTWIFTTTAQGQANLIDGIDGQPLIDRCKAIPLTTVDVEDPFVTRLLAVATAHGFTVPPDRAAELLRRGRYSLRAALDWLGTPASMPYLNTAAIAAA